MLQAGLEREAPGPDGPIQFRGWSHHPLGVGGRGTHFGFVQEGVTRLCCSAGSFNLATGMYFSAPGPGSLRGLSWYFNKHITNSMYQEAIVEVKSYIENRLGGDYYTMCMQDMQNCMCEFDKYCRVLTGTGRSKRKYAGS